MAGNYIVVYTCWICDWDYGEGRLEHICRSVLLYFKVHHQVQI